MQYWWGMEEESRSRECMWWRNTEQQCKSIPVWIRICYFFCWADTKKRGTKRWLLTTLSVPTRTEGGFWFDETISEIKFAVMPMIDMSDTTCKPRMTVKLAPRAPNPGPCILTDNLVVLKSKQIRFSLEWLKRMSQKDCSLRLNDKDIARM